MTEPLPDPLVPPDVDLSKLDGFMLDTVRLLGSELVAISTGDEFKAAVILWCRAWKQRPACSLPDDDRILSSFAMLPMPKWRKVKAIALRGFVKCSDGRLYHKVLSADAIRAHKASKKRAAAYEKWRNGESGDQDDPPAGPAATRSQRLAEARRKGVHTAEKWQAMLEVFSHTCVQCRVQNPRGGIVKDHILPIYQGGSDGIDNLQPLCTSCNSRKGPDSTDHRNGACADWQKRLHECLQKRLHNGSETPPKDGTGRDGTINDDDPSEVVVRGFMAVRKELWPLTPSLPSVQSTLRTQAKAYLEAGATAPMCVEVIRRVAVQKAEKNEGPPTNLGFCRLSVETEIRNAAKAEQPRAGGEGVQRSQFSDALEKWSRLPMHERDKTPRPQMTDYSTPQTGAQA